jgi:hypothetical protein
MFEWQLRYLISECETMSAPIFGERVTAANSRE